VQSWTQTCKFPAIVKNSLLTRVVSGGRECMRKWSVIHHRDQSNRIFSGVNRRRAPCHDSHNRTICTCRCAARNIGFLFKATPLLLLQTWNLQLVVGAILNASRRYCANALFLSERVSKDVLSLIQNSHNLEPIFSLRIIFLHDHV